MNIEPGEYVWAKVVGYPWWPGKVISDQELNEVNPKHKKPMSSFKVNVFFEHFHQYEIVRSPSRIFRFECPKKNLFIQKGLNSKKWKRDFQISLESAQIIQPKSSNRINNENDKKQKIDARESTKRKVDKKRKNTFTYSSRKCRLRLSDSFEDFDGNLDCEAGEIERKWPSVLSHSDTVCEKESSDEELPEGLSPIKSEIHLEPGSIVLFRWRNNPFWPVYVKRVYKQKTNLKVSVIFISAKDKFHKTIRVQYSPQKIKSYDAACKVIQKVPEDVKEDFERACKLCDDYLEKKALGLWTGTVPGMPEDFNLVDDVERDEADYEIIEAEEQNDSRSLVAVGFDSTEKMPKEKNRLGKRNKNCRKLVDFCLSNKAKEHLFAIFHETRKCERHRIFKYGTTVEKKTLRHQGFGPLEDDAETEKLLSAYAEWYKEVGGCSLPNTNYIFDVWIPEIIVYGLTKVTKYSRGRAEALFSKGYKYTKIELKKIHDSLKKTSMSEDEKFVFRQKFDKKIENLKDMLEIS